MLTKSIYSFHEKCIRNYENLLLALESENLYAKRLPAGTIVEAKDEYSRLRIWGEQTYAVLPQRARRSLDAQLRDDEETKKIITGTLKRLSDHITRDQAADDAYVSSSSSDGSQPEQDNIYGAKAEKGLAAVYGGITSLYRIAALLRRPRITNKYLKSRNRRAPINLLVSSLDYTRITDKVRFWRGYMTDRVAGDDELGVTENDLQLRRELGDHQLSDIGFLCQRLTRANTLRREQFDYWTEHPDVPESYRFDDTLRSQGTATTPSRDESSKEVLDRSKAAAPRSVFSTSARTTFSSVGHTTLQDDRTKVSRPRTRYAASNVAGSNATRVPGIPRCPPEETDFECPFCHTELDWTKMQDRMVWKRKWICPEDCRETFRSKSAIIEHISNKHFNGLEAHQISTFADMCEREIDATESEQCLICLETMSLFRLQQHLATHMEEIALFVLPSQPQDDEAERNHDDMNEESLLGSGDVPEQAETSYEEDQVLVSGNSHSRPEEDLGSLGEGSRVGQSSVAVILDNGKSSNIYDEVVQDALLARAIREKELADAATAASENTEREAMTAAAIAKVENEKAIAEAKAAHEELLVKAKTAADAAEAAKKAAEAERDANKPGPDADQAPIKFTDAVGRKSTLPWHLVKTWEGTEGLIKQAFVHIENIGPHVADGHYHLLGPNNEIILPQVWEVVVQPGWDIKMELWPLPESDKPTNLLDPPDLDIRVDGGDSGDDGRKIDSSGSSKKQGELAFTKTSSKKQGVPAFTKWMLGGTRPRPKRAQNEKDHETTSSEGSTDDEYSEVEPEGEADLPDIIALPHTVGAREPDRRWHKGSSAKSIGKQTDFFVHEYSPPRDVKLSSTPRKVVETGPKNYTFANHGPEYYESQNTIQEDETLAEEHQEHTLEQTEPHETINEEDERAEARIKMLAIMRARAYALAAETTPGTLPSEEE
ncbi:hypothetical protein D6C78_09876 [Aureobasidium pullulans]|uniref:C2H2-type domain-containing protein n=1 Tax=Aureobasidium pullulans TaxID=5580 RepID=A0A4V4LCX0_AURPU|nr:hypothetical protein D6C78_09876 [Aureobasidium pullulans]